MQSVQNYYYCFTAIIQDNRVSYDGYISAWMSCMFSRTTDVVTSTARYCTCLHRHGTASAAAKTAAHCTNSPVYLVLPRQTAAA